MTAYITARNTARRTRQSHARYLSWLTAQGQLPTVEQRRRLADLDEARLVAWQAWQNARIEHFRAHGIEVAA